jgi:hypothetical protein
MVTQSNNDEPRAEVVLTQTDTIITDAFMRNLGNISGNAFDDAMALAKDIIGEDVKSFADEMGTGFAILAKEDKAQLIGVQSLFLKWRFTDGDFGRYVNVAVLTQDGRKLILNDGSSGICQQLWDYTKTTAKDNYMLAKRGLRESTYATCGNCGKPRDTREDECAVCHDDDTKRGVGSTYYIDLAA